MVSLATAKEIGEGISEALNTGRETRKTEPLEWEAGASEIREEGHEVCCDDEDAEKWLNMSRDDMDVQWSKLAKDMMEI